MVRFQVREQGVGDVDDRHVEAVRPRRDGGVAVEDRRVVQIAPGFRGPSEDGPPQRGRVHVVAHFERAAVADELPQPLDQLVVGGCGRHVVARGLELSARAADPVAGGRYVRLRDGKQTLALGAP